MKLLTGLTGDSPAAPSARGQTTLPFDKENVNEAFCETFLSSARLLGCFGDGSQQPVDG